MTQKEAVLKYIKKHGSITPKEAVNKLGIYRLGGIIYFLRQEDGVEIVTKNISEKNRYGYTSTYGKYFLKEEGK